LIPSIADEANLNRSSDLHWPLEMLGSLYNSLMEVVGGGCPCAFEDDTDDAETSETELGQTISGHSAAIFGLASAQIDRENTSGSTAVATADTSEQGETFDKVREKIEQKMTNSDNFVEPGSELQAAIAMSLKPLNSDDEDGAVSTDVDDVIECVVCMEEFTKENPSVRTLCGCGENRSLFHLGCLYEWLDRQPNCPTCRQEIFFEEATQPGL